MKFLTLSNDLPCTAQAIKNLLSDNTEHQKSVISVFKQHNERMAKLVGQEYSPRTLQRYETTLNHTRAFIQWKFKQDDQE